MKDTLIRSFLSLCATALLLIPFWIWLSAWFLMAPEGFWQKFVIFGLGVWFLGFFQLVCLFFLALALVAIWDS